MDWETVIEALTVTMRGAELSAKVTDDPVHRLEAQIVSGVAGCLANAFSQGLAQHQINSKESSDGA